MFLNVACLFKSTVNSSLNFSSAIFTNTESLCIVKFLPVCSFVFMSITGSRKRQMTIGKSHSGGSDADDESLQPAKQPNRKSLSSVSFASTPFVRGSPSVPAHVSPISLSFASKNSSYKSADGTFTSGSARTVRSSVGSASGSSVGDNSKVDPEEEVTITNDTTQPEGEFSRIFSSLKISLSNPVRRRRGAGA